MSEKLLKLLCVSLILALLAGATAPILAAPRDQDSTACKGTEYTIQQDDWLSKLADKFYGDVLAYPAIAIATNEAARTDGSYATIEDFNAIEVGEKLCIPSVEDAEMLMQTWEQELELVKILRPAPIEVPQTTKSFTEDDHYIKDEVILTGQRADVEEVVNQVNQGKTLLSLREETNFEGIDRGAPYPTPLRFHPDQVRNLTIGLYQILGDIEVPDVIAEIYQEIQELNVNVYADPNYLTKRSVRFSPWDPGGSPLTQNPVGPAAETVYLTQWALGPAYGINLFDQAGNRLVERCGEGTLIAIFDTSPFISPPYEFDIQRPEWPNLSCGSPPSQKDLKLHVIHPMLNGTLTSPPPFLNVQDHGLFVAGLVHVVAPGSQKYLIRVLNADGQGTLFGLAKALVDFTRETLMHPPIEQQYMSKTVINLSLGLDEPGGPNDVLDQQELSQITTQTKNLIDTQAMSEESLQLLTALAGSTDAPVVALETPLAVAYGYGAVIVAAAGNESYTSPGSPQPSQKPASYPFVVGVASSNKGGSKSCFSNLGDIAAPSGDGDQGTFEGTTLACAPQLNQCGGQACDYAVVSLSLSSTTGYAYWVGTSFAAPEVSGLAALLLERGVPAQQVFTRMLTTSVTGANLGQPIIDVKQAVP